LWLQSAAQGNVSNAQSLQTQGFQPYTGQQVADFSGQQQQSFGFGTDIANASKANVAPGQAALTTALNNSTGPAPQVNPETISSQMSPYMNQYVNLALQPQLAQAANAYMLQSQAQQGEATAAGAFGDPREAILKGNLGLNYALENQGLVGNAYNAAFANAIGAGAQDVATNLQGQTTNAALQNQQIQNQLNASNTAFNQGTGAATLENTFGAQQTAQQQAALNAQYNQWLMAQQYPFQTNQLVNSDVSAALPTNVNTTLTQPNNAGWGIAGALIGAGGKALAAADGGELPSGAPTVVGERGPELFVPKQAGSVVPYEHLKKALEKKKGVTAPKHRPPSFGIAA
jgi:hypothetical protein